MTDKELLERAILARNFSYSPYSKYKVGAALMTVDGRVFVGCNIENSAFSPTVCAERVAFFKAISDGCYNFEKIAVVGGSKTLSSDCTPCGVCRQVMTEFCSKDFKVILGVPENYKVCLLKDLLPLAFNG